MNASIGTRKITGELHTEKQLVGEINSFKFVGISMSDVLPELKEENFGKFAIVQNELYICLKQNNVLKWKKILTEE